MLRRFKMFTPLTEEQSKYCRENYRKGITHCAEYTNKSKSYISDFFKKNNLVLTKEEKWLVASMGRRYNEDQVTVKSPQFLDIQTPEVAYFLGYFWADGCARDRGWCFSICIATEDYLNIKERVLDKMGYWPASKIKKNHKKYKECTQLRVHNSTVKEFLISTDHHIKSYVNSDKILSKIPDRLKHYWWRGLLDGDGHIGLDKNGYHINIAATHDYDWSSAVRLFNWLGITKYSIVKTVSEKGRNSSIKLDARDNVFKFLSYIYQNRESDGIGLNRKYKRYLAFVRRAEDNKYENRTEKLKEAGIKANFHPDRKRKNLVRGVKKNGRGWACVVGTEYFGNYSNRDAAINAYNYYGRETYGDIFYPNPVSVYMEKEEFAKFLIEKKKHSKYKWISRRKDNGRWYAYLRPKGMPFKEIGCYLTEFEALSGYNKYVVENSLPYKTQEWTGPSSESGEKFKPFAEDKTKIE